MKRRTSISNMIRRVSAVILTPEATTPSQLNTNE
jgi:hypothetical protein